MTDLARRSPDTRSPWSDDEVVVRRIAWASSWLENLLANPDLLPRGRHLALGTGGTLRFDAPFERGSCGVLEGWRAPGRLSDHPARLTRSSRVTVEVAPWSRETTELRIVPRSRQAMRRWGGRRRRRHWRLAHDAADELVRIFDS